MKRSLYPTETLAWSEAAKRKCPYTASGRHSIVRRGDTTATPTTVGNCLRCGTSAETILREQPGVDDLQPTTAS